MCLLSLQMVLFRGQLIVALPCVTTIFLTQHFPVKFFTLAFAKFQATQAVAIVGFPVWSWSSLTWPERHQHCCAWRIGVVELWKLFGFSLSLDIVGDKLRGNTQACSHPRQSPMQGPIPSHRKMGWTFLCHLWAMADFEQRNWRSPESGSAWFSSLGMNLARQGSRPPPQKKVKSEWTALLRFWVGREALKEINSDTWSCNKRGKRDMTWTKNTPQNFQKTLLKHQKLKLFKACTSCMWIQQEETRNIIGIISRFVEQDTQGLEIYSCVLPVYFLCLFLNGLGSSNKKFERKR